MKLKIGKNTYETKQVTGNFPIEFYKNTGFDIFDLEDADLSVLNRYEIMLNIAYVLTGRTDTIEEFANEFTIADLIEAYTDIVKCYADTTKPKVESKSEKK